MNGRGEKERTKEAKDENKGKYEKWKERRGKGRTEE
jgi:hypothetical protein